MSIKIIVTNGEETTRIVGYVNDRDIVTISNYIFDKWSIGSSTCLPVNFEDAQEYVECMRQAFEAAKLNGA